MYRISPPTKSAKPGFIPLKIKNNINHKINVKRKLSTFETLKININILIVCNCIMANDIKTLNFCDFLKTTLQKLKEYKEIN